MFFDPLTHITADINEIVGNSVTVPKKCDNYLLIIKKIFDLPLIYSPPDFFSLLFFLPLPYNCMQ